jgi:hypothetical protein
MNDQKTLEFKTTGAFPSIGLNLGIYIHKRTHNHFFLPYTVSVYVKFQEAPTTGLKVIYGSFPDLKPLTTPHLVVALHRVTRRCGRPQ